jgi:hypothetical protein
VLPTLGGYIVDAGAKIDLDRLEVIIHHMASHERAMFEFVSFNLDNLGGGDVQEGTTGSDEDVFGFNSDSDLPTYDEERFRADLKVCLSFLSFLSLLLTQEVFKNKQTGYWSQPRT